VSSEETSEKLIATATQEFARYGYDGTDVNRISRRSGMAPTTFYRCFKDKLDIFLAVYQRWVARERLLMRVLMTLQASDEELVETCVSHHRDHLQFRRSLRLLTCQEPRVRRARALSRLEAIAEIRVWRGERVADDERMALDLIQLERLADTLAEGEMADMALGEAQARADLAAMLRRFRPAKAGSVESPQNDVAPLEAAISA